MLDQLKERRKEKGTKKERRKKKLPEKEGL